VRRFPALDMPIEAMNEVMHPYFRRLRDTRDIRIPGSVELFRTLAARYPAGIVSGSTRRDVEHGIHMLGLDGLVEVYIGSEDTPRGKPAPDGFLLAARQLKTPAEACVVFEDSCAGVRAAKAAGMRCVALARPGRPVQDLSGADLVVETLAAFNLDRLPE
jgi:beta-phosphoglucomutase-like phosphatase (HAD superfamily)